MDSFTRRQFLGLLAVIATSSGYVLKKITENSRTFPKTFISGQNASLFHQMRDGTFDDLEIHEDNKFYDCVVLGGGVSGLSSIYHLETDQDKQFLLLEGQGVIGGNAQSGQNSLGRYPYGAHYLPIPGKELSELNSFLSKTGIIKNYDTAGNPIYNEEYLIQHPETKLLFKGKWHDGLIPFSDLSDEDLRQTNYFLNIVDRLSNETGKDFKKAFTLPVCQCSTDKTYLDLDKISFKEFLISQGISSEFVLWYANYATIDDYGTNIDETSAWAGIHYFAAREKNLNAPDLFTWPEGNGFLVEKFTRLIKSPVKLDRVVFSVSKLPGSFQVKYYDGNENKVYSLKTKTIISSLPHFINQRVFSVDFQIPQLELEYVPWFVANLSIPDLPEEFQNIPWDSVSFHSESLGFVRADHQNLDKKHRGTVLTYYFPKNTKSSSSSRLELATTSPEDLGRSVLEELSKFYPGLEKKVTEIDLWIWGHAMSKPKSGRMAKVISEPLKEITRGLYFAHTDYSGISIFEEAFYQGVRAAAEIKKILN